MPTNIPVPPQITAFTDDQIGRRVYNTIPEAKTGSIDLLVIGGGSFGVILAEHLFRLEDPQRTPIQPPSPIADAMGNELNAKKEPAHKAHRIIVVDAGPHGLPEHTQNLATGLGLGLGEFPDRLDKSVAKPGNTPWVSDTEFPGLAWVVGGRSLFWGGWSPELADSELTRWPADVVEDFKGRRFPEAKRQLGTDTTNEFIFGPLHCALRERLFQGVRRGDVPAAFLVGSPEDLEAPLAVQSAPPRSGYFPTNKFSTIPLLISATRRSLDEVGINNDANKRLMVVPNCRVTKLTEKGGRVESADIEYEELSVQSVGSGNPQLVSALKKETLPLSSRGKVVIALGTIESTRLVKNSFDRQDVGRNLMAHLRSNLVVRFPRSNFQHLPSELEGSALFLKGRTANGHFHFQITAFGNPTDLNWDTEAELFKTIPSVDQIDYFRELDDRFIIMVVRGIGEMESDTSATCKSRVELDASGRAKVTIVPTTKDTALWEEMDTAAEQVAKVFAAGAQIDYLWEYDWGSVWRPVPPPHAPKGNRNKPSTPPKVGVRDGLGTTHHEAGTLWMGPGTGHDKAISDSSGRIHHISNAYVAGPALFPTVGSPNPMLTGTAMARRTAHIIARQPLLTEADGTVQALAPAERRHWRIAGEGRFKDDGTGGIVAEGGLGLLWFSKWRLRNFELTVEWKATAKTDNSGIFVRFPDPMGNPWIAVDRGYEIQIDDTGWHDDPAERGRPTYQTGAIYTFQGPTSVASKDPNGQDPWNTFIIRVVGQEYKVTLNDVPVINRFIGNRSEDGFIGLQNHGSPVTFRSVLIKPLPTV